jgi:ABC-type uncharacterized transport system fused permease/ATPase subunit
MERRLYRICQEHQVTYITIAHRPALKSYHQQLLSIGDGQQGFTLEPIERDEKLIARTLHSAKASIVSQEDEQSMLAFKKSRSAAYATQAEIKPMPAERSTFSRLWRMMKISWPARSLVKLSAIGLLIVAQTLNEDLLFGNTGKMFGCLMTRDKAGFMVLVRNAALGAFGQSVIWETLRYMQQELGTEMAEKMWRNLMARYMSHNFYYVLPHQDGRIKDAELR